MNATQPKTPDVPDPVTPKPDMPSPDVPDVKTPKMQVPDVPDVPDVKTPKMQVPDATVGVTGSDEVQAPLTKREKHLVSIITGQVLNQIDPVLIKMQQISNEAVSMGAQQKVQEIEQGIKNRIEMRINKINTLLGRRWV